MCRCADQSLVTFMILKYFFIYHFNPSIFISQKYLKFIFINPILYIKLNKKFKNKIYNV